MAKNTRKIPNPPQTPGKARAFIEMCGRHPFATGIFALLGIFGLLFSFVTFGLDQHQSRLDQIQTDRMEGTVNAAASDVAEIAASATDAPLTDPIESRAFPIANSVDNVAFRGTAQVPTVEWVFANVKDSFPNLFILQWSIRSGANRDFVQIAPYLVVDVTDVQPVPRDLSALYAGERGAASELRSFEAALRPQKGWQFAALVDGDTGETRNDIDYFTLSPREPEEFYLTLSYVPGYIYTYRVGLHYRFQNRDAVHWLSGPIRAGVPDYPLPVAQYESGQAGGEGFAVRDHPDYLADNKTAVPARSAVLTKAVSAGKVFTPSQLPALR